jgi:hypothetical protein
MNPFRPIPSHSATESQSLRFSVKIFRLSPLDGGREGWQEPKNFFTTKLNGLSAVLFQAGSIHCCPCSYIEPHPEPFQPSSPSHCLLIYRNFNIHFAFTSRSSQCPFCTNFHKKKISCVHFSYPH